MCHATGCWRCGRWVQACQAQAKMSDEARGRAWWAHVQVLADDSMKGRQTGSEDYMRAAAYVTGKFKEYGLEPAGVMGRSISR